MNCRLVVVILNLGMGIGIKYNLYLLFIELDDVLMVLISQYVKVRS